MAISQNRASYWKKWALYIAPLLVVALVFGTKWLLRTDVDVIVDAQQMSVDSANRTALQHLSRVLMENCNRGTCAVYWSAEGRQYTMKYEPWDQLLKVSSTSAGVPHKRSFVLQPVSIADIEAVAAKNGDFSQLKNYVLSAY